MESRVKSIAVSAGKVNSGDGITVKYPGRTLRKLDMESHSRKSCYHQLPQAQEEEKSDDGHY